MAIRFIGALVDDMAEVVEPSRIGWAPLRQPQLAALAPLPAAGREAQDFGRHSAPLERPCKYVGTSRGDGDRPTAHRTAIIDQQADHRILELRLALDLVAKRMAGSDN